LRDSRKINYFSRGGLLGKISIALHNVDISHSTRSMDSRSWTKWKGMKLVVVLMTVPYAHKSGKTV
jgi:hypothetical protein